MGLLSSVCLTAALITLDFAKQASANATSTGYLITFNEYTPLLSSAPSCFRTGCGSRELVNMASGCDPNAACYPVWTLINEQHQKSKDWCSRAHKDPACRISGWPVLNVTAFCAQSQPWLFGTTPGCCSSPSDAIALSTWMTKMCNGSWQDPFKHYGAMAPPDWWQWLLPWNWTVQPENSTSITVSTPKCPSSPRYLGLFVIENFLFSSFVFFYTWLQLWWVRAKEVPDPKVRQWTKRISKLFKPWKWLKKKTVVLVKKLNCFDLSSDDSSGLGAAVSTIFGAIVLTGFQVGINFATAYLVKRTPGYDHVPFALLALLFCARPRLGWIACIISKTPRSWLTNYFHLSEPRGVIKGRQAVSKVAISSSVSEIIMQLVGAYALGRTAHTGANRGFYLVNHLWGYWEGKDARIMYLGAIFWLVACVIIVVVWGIVLYWHAAISQGLEATGRFLRSTAKNTRERLPGRAARRRRQQELSDGQKGGDQENSNLLQGDPLNEKVEPVQDGHHTLRGGGSDVHSSSTEINQPMRPEQFRLRPHNRRDGYTPVAFDPETMAMRPSDFPTAPVVAPGTLSSATSTLVNSHNTDEIYRAPPWALTPGDPITALPTAARAAPSDDLYPDTAYHGLTSGTVVGDQEPDSEQSSIEELPQVLKDGQGPILTLGILIGLVSYVAQWLFWAGYVKTSGAKFCPPDLASLGTLWTIASIFGMGAHYGFM